MNILKSIWYIGLINDVPGALLKVFKYRIHRKWNVWSGGEILTLGDL